MTLIAFPARPHWPNRTAAREAIHAERKAEYEALFNRPDVEPHPPAPALTAEEIRMIFPQRFRCEAIRADISDYEAALARWRWWLERLAWAFGGFFAASVLAYAQARGWL